MRYQTGGRSMIDLSNIMQIACDLICKYPEDLTEEELTEKCEICQLASAVQTMIAEKRD